MGEKAVITSLPESFLCDTIRPIVLIVHYSESTAGADASVEVSKLHNTSGASCAVLMPSLKKT